MPTPECVFSLVKCSRHFVLDAEVTERSTCAIAGVASAPVAGGCQASDGAANISVAAVEGCAPAVAASSHITVANIRQQFVKRIETESFWPSLGPAIGASDDLREKNRGGAWPAMDRRIESTLIATTATHLKVRYHRA